jgi:phospholipid/cholesterol/gamma-HCH transport system permease protein
VTSTFESVGRTLMSLLRAGRILAFVFARTLHFLLRGEPQPGRVAHYMYAIGNQSLVFLVVVMGFIGMIVVYQGGVQLERVIPDMSQLGSTFLELLIKDLAPSIAALMLATRVGAGIAAEIGSMVVTEQVDAMRMCAADPIDYLIRPRFLACIVMTFALVIISTFVAGTTGMMTANAFFAVAPSTFLDFREVDGGDITVCVCKALAYGATIPVVSGYCGLYTHGGSEGVGSATTRAVVNSSLGIIMLNFLITSLGYALFE